MYRALLLSFMVVGVGLMLGAVFEPRLYQAARGVFGLPKQTEMNDAWAFAVSHQMRLDRTVRPEDVLVIGDSHVQGMNVAMLDSKAVNMGIGGDTSRGVFTRLAQFQSDESVSAIILAVGLNDLIYRSPMEAIENIVAVLQMASAPVILSAVLPVDEAVLPSRIPFTNALIRELNEGFADACSENCFFVKTPDALISADGNLKQHEGDGIHLNPRGYALWVESLKTALADVRLADAEPTVETFWQACLPSLSAPPADGFYRVRSIGGSPSATDTITKLILDDLKTGTFTSPWMYEGDRTITPVVGGYSVLTDSTDTPRAVLKTTGLMTLPFNQITEKETALDGPAVRSLDVWRPIHVTFFANELKARGKSFAEDMPVTVEKFEVVCKGA